MAFVLEVTIDTNMYVSLNRNTPKIDQLKGMPQIGRKMKTIKSQPCAPLHGLAIWQCL